MSAKADARTKTFSENFCATAQLYKQHTMPLATHAPSAGTTLGHNTSSTNTVDHMRSFFSADCTSRNFWFCQQQKWQCCDLWQGTILPQSHYCILGVGTKVEAEAELLPCWQTGHVTTQHLLQKSVQALGVPLAV